MTSKIKQAVLSFSENTSLHGISYTTNQKLSTLTRLVWMLLFVLMVGSFLRLFTGTWMNYFSYPTVTSVEYQTTDSISFPSVTICNSNVARCSAIIKDNNALYVFKNSPLAIRKLPNPELPVNESTIGLADIIYRVAHQPGDMYLECAFDSQFQTPCNVSKEITWTYSSDGLCHTFNSQQYINEYGGKITTRPGGNYGLYLLINIEEYDYCFTARNTSGIQVLVHEPHALPDVKVMGFTVSAGTETLAAVKKTAVKQLPEPYAKPPNLCENTYTSDYKNSLEYFSDYSFSGCRQECRINNQLSECGCASQLLGGNNYPVCSYTQFINCSSPAQTKYDDDPSIEARCGCVPECEETIYDVTVSSSAINEYIKKRVVEKANVPSLNTHNFDKNVIGLKIFFGEMRHTLIEQKSLYTTVSLFGELGGQLGLCLGASILTLAELLQLLIKLCVCYCKNPLKQNATEDGN